LGWRELRRVIRENQWQQLDANLKIRHYEISEKGAGRFLCQSELKIRRYERLEKRTGLKTRRYNYWNYCWGRR
jgi:hypothetical protein